MSLGYEAALKSQNELLPKDGAGNSDATSFLSGVGGFLNPVAAGLGLVGGASGLFGNDPGSSDLAISGGDFYSGNFQYSSGKNGILEQTPTWLFIIAGVVIVLILKKGK